MERIALRTILGLAVEIREPRAKGVAAERAAYERDQLIVRRKDNARIIAVIDRDGFFDPDGNYPLRA